MSIRSRCRDSPAASIPTRTASSSSCEAPPLPPAAPINIPSRKMGSAPWPGIKSPPCCSMKARMKGACEFSVSSPLALPKQAEARALPREIGGVRHDAPSIRDIAIKSPRRSVTDMASSTPFSLALARPASMICLASESVIELISLLLGHSVINLDCRLNVSTGISLSQSRRREIRLRCGGR